MAVLLPTVGQPLSTLPIRISAMLLATSRPDEFVDSPGSGGLLAALGSEVVNALRVRGQHLTGLTGLKNSMEKQWQD
jgi:hypothetical protein